MKTETDMPTPLFPEDLTPGSRDLCLAMQRRSAISTPFGWRLELSRGRVNRRPTTSAVYPSALAKLIGLGLAETTKAEQSIGPPIMRANLTAAGRSMAKRLGKRQVLRR